MLMILLSVSVSDQLITEGPNPGGTIYLNKALHHLHHGVRNKRELIAKSD